MKKWFSNRWESLKNAVAYVRGIFSLKLTILYVALTIGCWYADIGPLYFLGIVSIVLLIDAVSYAQGIHVERDIHQRNEIRKRA